MDERKLPSPSKRIPADVLTTQLRTWNSVKKELPAEGYDEVLQPTALRVVPSTFVESSAAAVNAGTVDDQIGRFRELSEAGVAEVMISLPDLDTLDAVADVISAFRVQVQLE